MKILVKSKIKEHDEVMCGNKHTHQTKQVE